MKKLLAIVLSLAAAFQFAVVPAVFAATDQNNPTTLLGQTGLGGANQSPDQAANSLPIVVGNLIRIALSVLGVIFLLLILYAGFNWMTAAGDEGKVETAKSTLTRAVIGLIIIISAYAITSFVIIRLQVASGTLGP